MPDTNFITVLGASYYALTQIPNSLPKRLSTKLSASLSDLDFVHLNSNRISSEVRKVLRFPADNLRVGLQRSVEGLIQKKEDKESVRRESTVARKYFGNLVRESADITNGVRRVDLEGPVPGLSGLEEGEE
jgi:mitofusin 2